MKLENLTTEQLAKKTGEVLRDEKEAIRLVHRGETDGALKQQKATEEKNRIQTFIESDKGGVIMGEAVEEHQKRLEEEIRKTYYNGQIEKGDELTREKEKTLYGYFPAKLDRENDPSNMSLVKRFNVSKENIAKLFRKKK